jgi:hypothetical protein
LGDEYEHALSAATQEEIIDLAGKRVLVCVLLCLEQHRCSQAILFINPLNITFKNIASYNQNLLFNVV